MVHLLLRVTEGAPTPIIPIITTVADCGGSVNVGVDIGNGQQGKIEPNRD